MSIIDIGTQVDTKRLCAEGILEDYLRYAENQESPQDFHMWTCIGMIAITLGRNVYVDMGAWKTYPNLYIILIGESAITHKSTALKMGVSPLKQALPNIPDLAQKFSPESLSHFLKGLTNDEKYGRAEAYVHASELSVLIGQSKLDDSLLKLLTDLWDSPDVHKYMTLSRGIEEAREVCLNILGGSTPDWLKNSVPDEALEGGFFSRLILVDRPPSGRKNPFPVLSLSARNSIEKVKHDLISIRKNLSGEFTLTPAARMVYGEWYSEYNHPDKARSFMRGYYGRKGDFVLKLAMISSANYSNSMQITDEDILFAIKVLNENEVYTEGLVKFLGTTQDGKKYIGILNRIKKGIIHVPKNLMLTKKEIQEGNFEYEVKPGIEHSTLMRAVGYQMKAMDLADVIEALTQAGEITSTLVGSKKYYVYTGVVE